MARSGRHWFCYWLCRDLGRSRMASLLGGTAFALSGVVGTIDWPQMLNGAIWAPLVLLLAVPRPGPQPHGVFAWWNGVRPLRGCRHHRLASNVEWRDLGATGSD